MLRRASHVVRASNAFAATRFASDTTIVGIDLGTTNSCVAYMLNEQVSVCENAEGSRTTPSVVAVTKDKQLLVGGPARRQAVTNPSNTFYAVKRLIGRREADETISRARASVPYAIVASDNGDAWVADTHGTKYSPSTIASHVLRKMKETAEARLGHSVSRAVVTVPAYFNDQQRQATHDAGRIAGLEIARVINEPTAAALSYGLDKDEENTIAVFDLGGGTFDISILDIKGGVFTVKATNGDTFLGGEDIDEALLERFVEVFKEKEGVNLRGDVVAIQRLREGAEKAKKELDHVSSASIEMPYIKVVDGTPKHFEYTLTREEFEKLTDPLINRCIEPCRTCLKDAGLKTTDITQVILVGGMTRTPKVIETVRRMFKREPHRGVNPDEVVAMGAAIQGSVIAGHTTGLVLVDVTPLSLGTEIAGGFFSRIIKKNTAIPCKESAMYTTMHDNSTSIMVSVLQGERELAKDNKLLGKFVLDNLPPLPRGVPQIEITFAIDKNGIIHVTAMDKGTKNKSDISVQSKGGLTEEEIKRMIHDAEINKEKDAAIKQLIEERNNADQLVRSTRTFADSSEGSSDLKTDVKKACDELEAALADDNVDANKLKEMCKKVSDLTGKLYSARSA
ncbi:Chaperone protein DnaK [Diplonema papillatum]|nr:Chaperone protein DnaK [Diplonema papillatum]